MKFLRFRFLVALFCFDVALASNAAGQQWKAGVAKCNITPEPGLWLAGYATRTNGAEGKVTDLWVKALALEDAEGGKAVILTSDTLGIPQSIYQHCVTALKQKDGLEPGQIILSGSHTHCGPVLRNMLYAAYPLDDRQRALIEDYSKIFESNVIATIEHAMSDLSPAVLRSAEGEADFAVNRRNNREGAVPKLIQDGGLKGPVDHSVPMLTVSGSEGKLEAVLFGYACHNTTMSFNKWSGDYAGFAQIALEKSHPGVTAMFFMGCGGDQNPLPRGRLELCERYGNMLAAAVEEALLSQPKILAPALTTKLEMIDLPFGPEPTRHELETMKVGAQPSGRRWAEHWLTELNAGRTLPRSYPYPLQVWRLGDRINLIAMGGEPVVDYSLKFKKEFGPGTWVAGYCNDVMTYIPSARVLREGGYEGGKAMIPYGQPALSWGESVEELITAGAERLIASANRRQQ
jgi:hypothetical protein